MDDSSCPTARWCGPPSWSSPFRRLCFQPPFETPCSEPSVNCISTYAARGGCLFDQECLPTATGQPQRCVDGTCSSYSSGNPRALSQVSYEDFLRLSGAVASASCAPSALPPTIAMCREPMLLVEHEGRRQVVCPIPYDPETMPQCKQCMRLGFGCGRYRDQNCPNAFSDYQRCREFERCFKYDILFPNGQTQPVGVVMTNECLGAARALLRQCAALCGNCALQDCATIGSPVPIDPLRPAITIPTASACGGGCGTR